jgi:AI-2 transport protein TqsA
MDDRTASEGRRSKILIGLLALIAILLTGWALRATYVVTMPLAMALLVAIIIQPVRRRLAARLPERWQGLAIAGAIALIPAALALLVAVGWLAADMIASDAPRYAERLQAQWDSLVSWARRHNVPIPDQAAQGGGLHSQLGSWAATAVTSVWSILGFLVLVFFIALLLLLEAAAWRGKAHKAFDAERAAALLDSGDAIARQVRRYLAVRTALSAISAAAAGLWLLITGVDLVLVWVALTFLLNYVPNVGSIIAVILPSLVALVQLGPLWGLVVIVGLALIEQIIGNYIDPRWQGRVLDISPLVVLLSVIFWAWVWGVAGAVLAVPLTATIIIACMHVPALRPTAILLSRDGDIGKLEEQSTGDGNRSP